MFDVDAAFRNIPIHQSMRRFVALMLDDLVFMDLMLNFGKRPAPGIWGHVADAMAWILRHKGVQALLKWVDDFVFLRYPSTRNDDGSFSYSYDESLIWSTAETLGWPWAPSKFVPFAHSFVYIGFAWDLVLKTVQLPDAKKLKYLDRIASWVAKECQFVDDTEKLIGTLNHVSLVVPTGRSRLINFYNFRAGFKDSRRFARHSIPEKLWKDILWWDDLLCQAFVGMTILKLPELIDIQLFGDASTSWGIGLVIEGRWLAWEYRPQWQSKDRHIGWSEMVAVELMIRTLVSSGFRKVSVRLKSDNGGVVGALKKGCSRGSEINLILRKIIELMQEFEIWIECVWISTHENPADAPSRGEFPPRKQIHSHPPALPRHLKLYFFNSVQPNDPRILS